MSLIENLDPAFLRDILQAQYSTIGTPDSSPPSKGIVILGYDGTYVRRLRVDSTGRLLLVLG
jgi:hypothetical protein